LKFPALRARRRALLLVCVMLAAMACMRTGGPPEVAPRGVLQPGGARAGAKDDGAFRIVFGAPSGKASDVSEISLVFSRPLRSLTANVAPPKIVMSPPLAGHWIWVGGRALTFQRSLGERLPGATAVMVDVPAETRALDGTTLGSPYRLSFETPRPAVHEHRPEGDGHLPGTALDLFFTQPVTSAELEKHLELVAIRAGREQRLRFRVERPDPKADKHLRVIPDKPLPLDSTVRATVRAGLHGTEGPLPMLEPHSVEFRTYGPLRAKGSCYQPTQGLCEVGHAPSIELTNDVSWSAIRAALKVDPPVPLKWSSWQSGTERSRNFSLPIKTAPATAYTVSIGPELTDRFGQKLGKPFSQTFRYGDQRPLLTLGISGRAIEPAPRVTVPVGSVNIGRYEVVRAALTPKDILRMVEAERAGGSSSYQVFLGSPGLKREKVTTGAARNSLFRRDVEVSDLLSGGRGVFALAALAAEPRGHSPGPYLAKVSDLAITAKVADEGSVVWVTRLSSGQSVKDATVEVYRHGADARTYRADSQGIARIPAGDLTLKKESWDYEEDALVVARSGADWTYEAIRDRVPPWRLGVQTDLAPSLRRYGMIFTERGVYRPGDHVEVKGIVRSAARTGNAVSSEEPLDVLLRSPHGDVVETRRVTTNGFGTFALKLRIPATAGLGSFALSAQVPGSAPQAPDVLQGYFQVAEYRPAEFKLEVRAGAPSYRRGERARFDVLGSYLYGAPTSDAKARWAVSATPGTFTVPKHDAWVTDASSYYVDQDSTPPAGGMLANAEGRLDATGKLVLEQLLALPGYRGPVNVHTTVDVTDASHQTISTEASVLVHPADFYVALESPKDWFFTAPGSVEPKVLALGLRGERLSGRRVSLELVSRRWTLARESVPGEAAHAVSKVVDQVVARCDVTTAAEPRSCRLTAAVGGYFVVVARAQDDQQRPVQAAYGLYGIGSGEGSGGWGDSDRANVDLVLDKKEYRVGDTARVLVKSPFPEAEALVTVERQGVYRVERVKLRGPTPVVEVKVTDDFRPNAYVAVHLLRGRNAGRKEEAVGASYRLGYAELKVDPELRRLNVAVRPNAADFRPGAEVSVDLAVTDVQGRGAPAELTVFAVDEGVLMLTRYATPDPLPVFTASRPLSVSTLETRDALAKIGLAALESMLGADKGGDGGGGGDSSARSNFRQTAFFDPNVRTDAKGRASVRFKLPDGLTSYRIMATAVGMDDRYGFGNANVTVSKKLMARPALPRFLRAGDVLDAGVVVSTKGFSPGEVRVEARAEGLVLEGPATTQVKLGTDATREVRFRFRAERVGKAKLSFSVRGGGESDQVVVERAIERPAVLETVAVYGTSERSVAEQLGDLRGMRDDSGGLEVSLASTALVGLGSDLQVLSDYPYGCTEQLVSRLLPLVPLSELARDFGLPRPPNADLVIEKLVATILARQRDDGGFGMWPEAWESSRWVTPYALWVLDESAKRGVKVPKSALARGKSFLRTTLGQTFEKEPAAAALALDVLAMQGARDRGYEARLLEKVEALPTFARGLLLHALAVGKSERLPELLKRVEADLRIIGNTASVNENLGSRYAVLMDSPVRSSAIVLRGILAANPDHPLVEPLARGLLAARGSTGFRTTQEGAFGLLALDAYRRAREVKVPSFVARAWFGERALVTLEAKQRSTAAVTGSATMAELLKAPRGLLSFEKNGSGALHYEARLKSAPRDLPSTALDLGFFVQKVQRRVEPSELGGLRAAIPERSEARYSAGDLVVTDLVVVSPGAREYVAIDDPLPAGLEAVDSSLATNVLPPPLRTPIYSECEECEVEAGDAGLALAQGHAYLSLHHRQEIRDDRVLYFVDHMPAGVTRFRYLSRATSAGRFVVPPTRAEAMYEPEIFGRTAASIVEVR
jgi:uncharacterized protein YfaS (alpha-2-macroglobulin family)